MTFRVSVSMQKGGVGKTTTAINLAGALADRGHEVLAVDADPQGALTWKLGHQDAYLRADHALYDVMVDVGDLEFEDINELILEDEEYDIVPGHVRNFRLESQLHQEPRTEERLRITLDRIEHDYDYVVIDSPPNLGPLADGALLAAEHVLFPTHANEISQFSLDILFDEIETIEDVYDQYQIVTLGAVVNEVGQNGVSERMQEFFTGAFGEDHVFTVPDWTAIEHAIEYRTSVFAYDPGDAGYPWDEEKVETLRDIYDRIATHVEDYND